MQTSGISLAVQFEPSESPSGANQVVADLNSYHMPRMCVVDCCIPARIYLGHWPLRGKPNNFWCGPYRTMNRKNSTFVGLLPIARRPVFFGCEANPTRRSVFKWTCPARKSPNLCSFSGQVTIPPGCLAAACCLKDTRVTCPALMRMVFCGSSSLTRCQRRFANLRELVESWYPLVN